MTMDTFYKEYAGKDRWNWWTYSDGVRVAISAAWAERQIARGTARLVTVK